MQFVICLWHQKPCLVLFGVGNIVQYVAVLSRLGEGLQELMYLLSDNEVYCTHLQNLFAYLDLPNHMYQGSLTVEKRDDNEYYVEFKKCFVSVSKCRCLCA